VSASQQLLSWGQSVLATLGAMTPAEMMLNLGLSLATAAIAVALAMGGRRLLDLGAKRAPGPPTAERKVRTSRVVRFSTTVLEVILAAASAVMICSIWGLDVLGWLTAGLGQHLVGLGLKLCLLGLAAVAACELSAFVINHAVGRMIAASPEGRRQAQLNTLGPLIKGIAQTTIIVIIALMAMSEVGLKIGPLLAGAGVAGIALGFGAQTLVKDFLTGFFLIVEDIVSVGDVVRIGESGGLVEAMTLRTIRLRDFDGTLHVFPYGEAQIVHNLTKTFSFYVFNLQISYGSDIDGALRIMADVGGQMQADPAFSGLILEPIEVVGVDNLADSGVVLKARIKTLPIQQWKVGREYNRRIKLAFDEAGIEIPFPHMKLILPESQVAELAGRH
jgi:small conductance mechanosensitive channel